MKNIILTIVCVGIITPIFAQKSFYEQIKEQDTILSVYLEKNKEYRTGVDLVFENNSNDTIFLFTRFHNFSFGGEIPRYSGISIDITYFQTNRVTIVEPAKDVETKK